MKVSKHPIILSENLHFTAMPHPFFIIHNILTKIERCTKGVFSNLKVLQLLIFLSSRENHQMLPWQMNKTLIIKFSYSKMPCNAEFCVGLSAFPGIVFSLLMTTLFAKYFKIVQLGAMCSSQIVVS